MLNKRSLRQYILNNEKLFSLFAFLVNLRYFFSNRTRICGAGNKVKKLDFSFFRKVKIYVRGENNHIIIRKKCILRDTKIEVNGNNNIIVLGDKINIMEKGYFLIEGDNCKIEIGDSSLFRDGSFFVGESNTKISIGRNNFCGIVTFSTSDFHSIIDLKSGQRINSPNDVLVGNNNWITNYVSIRKGAVISNDSVIATYSIVLKPFMESNVIIGGQPAKVLKQGISWSREKLPFSE